MSRRESSERKYTSARERAEKQSSGFASACLKIPDGATLFKPKPGTMLLDILPYVAGEGNPWADEGNLHWERTYYVHRGIGANSDSVLCPRMTSKSKCPICEHRMRLMKEGDEENEELIKDLSPKQRNLYNVINLKEPDKGVQLWDISYHLFGKALDARLRNSEEDEGWDKFFFLEGGKTLRVGFEEKSFGGYNYMEVETIDFKDRKEDYEEDILDDVYCLDEIPIEMEYGELKKMFLETKEEKNDDSDEDDEPKKKSKHVDADEDEEPAPKKKKPIVDDDDEEEDETPVKKKKPAPSDDDDDWSDFDDDDDEEKPKKKKPADDEDADEDEPPPKKKKPTEDDEDDDWEEKPKKKSKPDEDEEDADDGSDDEDEKPVKKKNRFARQEGDKGWDNDDEDEKPKKKKRDEEDED